MNENAPSNRYLPEEEPEKRSIEIPANQFPSTYDQIPSSDDPMGRIELRGRAYQSLASGRNPWWLLIAGWIVFGSVTLMLAKIAFNAGAVTPWIFLTISIIPLLIVLRGTIAKVSSQ